MKERNFRRRGSDNDGGEDTTAAKRPNTASARPLSFADEYPVKRSTKPSSGSAMPFNPAPSAGTYTAFTHPIKPSPSCGLRFTSAPSSVPSNVEPQAGTSTALPNLDAISMSQQAELVKKSLVEKLSRLKESVALLCNTEEKLSASLSNVSALKHSLSAINEECIFIQKLRVLVCGICVCLQAPALDSVVMEAVLDATAAYRFGMSIRLICNICLFRDGGILTMPVIEELALDKLLCGKILPYLRGIQANIHDAIMSTEKVVSLMGIFAGPSVTGDRSPKLQPLVDYVLELKKGLKEKHCSFGQEIWSHFDCFSADKRGEELATAKSLPYLHKMLQALKEDDHAKEISRTYFETEDPF